MTIRTIACVAAFLGFASVAPFTAAMAQEAPVEPPFLEKAVQAGELPPVAERVPEHPLVVSFSEGQQPGRYGGTLRLLGGGAKDTRLLVIYGYARLVGYTPDYDIVSDLAESFDVEGEGRSFTFHLRPGHKWSDGEPFTAEDFRFYWEDRKSVV